MKLKQTNNSTSQFSNWAILFTQDAQNLHIVRNDGMNHRDKDLKIDLINGASEERQYPEINSCFDKRAVLSKIQWLIKNLQRWN